MEQPYKNDMLGQWTCETPTNSKSTNLLLPTPQENPQRRRRRRSFFNKYQCWPSSLSQLCAFSALCCFPGAVWKLHVHPIRGVTSGQSVCLRSWDDDMRDRVNEAQLPPDGDAAHPPGGAAGPSPQQRAHSIQVS